MLHHLLLVTHILFSVNIDMRGTSVLAISFYGIVSFTYMYYSFFFLLVVTGSADKTVKFWDLETFELIGSGGTEVTCVVFTTSSYALNRIQLFYLSFNFLIFSFLRLLGSVA